MIEKLFKKLTSFFKKDEPFKSVEVDPLPVQTDDEFGNTPSLDVWEDDLPNFDDKEDAA